MTGDRRSGTFGSLNASFSPALISTPDPGVSSPPVGPTIPFQFPFPFHDQCRQLLGLDRCLPQNPTSHRSPGKGESVAGCLGCSSFYQATTAVVLTPPFYHSVAQAAGLSHTNVVTWRLFGCLHTNSGQEGVASHFTHSCGIKFIFTVLFTDLPSMASSIK